MKLFQIATFAAIGMIAALPAAAEDVCGPLKILSSVTMVPDGPHMMVPVVINGVHKQLGLDTGGYTTQLSPSVVQELGLQPFEVGARLYSITGRMTASAVRVSSFVVGTLEAKNIALMVAVPDIGSWDGLLSTDLLLNYDIDLDFGLSKFSYVSPDHCPGRVIYWNAPKLAIVPMKFNKAEGHIRIPVTLDGQALEAIVDTGAASTVISLDLARSLFGLTPESPGVTKLGGVNGDNNVPSYGYVFKTLSFEGVEVHNLRVTLVTRVEEKNLKYKQKTGSLIGSMADEIDMTPNLIGMDVLKQLHVYIAYNERKLYISPASQPAAAPAGPQ